MEKYSNKSVRRQDRLLIEEDGLELLQNGEYGVLSFVDMTDGEASAYAVPMSYVWNEDGYVYMHCAPEGYKIDCIKHNNRVCLTIVGSTNVVSDKFTTAYESIILRGNIERSLSAEERMFALKLILKKYSPNNFEIGVKYAEKSFSRTEILRINIKSISGKSKRVM